MTSFSAILIHKSAFNLRTRANIRTNHILNIFFSSSNPENSGFTYYLLYPFLECINCGENKTM